MKYSYSEIKEGRLISLDVNTIEFNFHDQILEGIWVARLYVPSRLRGKGYARAAMERLCEDADLTKTYLVLCINPYDDGLTYEQLLSFYESLGFERQEVVEVEGESGELLVRQPQGE
jgi:predicted GNAT superfamily acetyltransferase